MPLSLLASVWRWFYRQVVWYHAKYWLLRHDRPKPAKPEWEPTRRMRPLAQTIDEMRRQDCIEQRVYWGNHQLDDAYATDIPACSPVYEGRTSDPGSEED